MNNTKLEVVRINEDVIATSCSNPSYPHLYISNATCNGATTHHYYIGFYPDGTVANSGCTDKQVEPGWYYSADAFNTLNSCDGSHNFDISSEPQSGYDCDQE